MFVGSLKSETEVWQAHGSGVGRPDPDGQVVGVQGVRSRRRRRGRGGSMTGREPGVGGRRGEARGEELMSGLLGRRL